METVRIKKIFPKVNADVDIFLMKHDEYHYVMDRVGVPERDARSMVMIDYRMIFANIDAIDDEIFDIVIAHEYGHIVEGESEEDADRFALNLLSEKDRNILIANWKVRHGHVYN